MVFVSVISSLIVGKFCRKTKILPNFPHFRDDGAEVDDNWSFSLSSTTGTGCGKLIDTHYLLHSHVVERPQSYCRTLYE